MKKLLIILLAPLLLGCESESTEESLIGKWISEENSDQSVEFTKDSVYLAASLNDNKEYKWHLSGDTIYMKLEDNDDSFTLLIKKIDASHLEIAEENVFSEGFGETKKLIKAY